MSEEEVSIPPLVPDPTSNLKPSASGSGVLEPHLVLIASFQVSNGRRFQFVTLFQTHSRQYSSKRSKSFPLIDCISVGVDRSNELRADAKAGRSLAEK
jgi:hypothetical protein